MGVDRGYRSWSHDFLVVRSSCTDAEIGAPIVFSGDGTMRAGRGSESPSYAQIALPWIGERIMNT